MRLTESQLRKMINEETLRITPVRPGQVMSQARAMYLAESVMQEGFLDNIIAAAKGGVAGVKSATGGTANLAKNVAQKAVQPLIDAGKAGAAALGKIADEASKNAAAEAAKSLSGALKKEITQQLSLIIQKLVKSGKPEKEAKTEANALVWGALSVAMKNALETGGEASEK